MKLLGQCQVIGGDSSLFLVMSSWQSSPLISLFPITYIFPYVFSAFALKKLKAGFPTFRHLFRFPFVFGSSCKTTSYVSLCFIFVQHCFGFFRQNRVNLNQSFGYILVYRAFANPKLFCGSPYSCLVFNNIVGKLHGSLFYITFQRYAPLTVDTLLTSNVA